MKAFLEPLYELGEFSEIQKSLSLYQGMTQVQGCIDSQKAHFIYGAGEKFPFKVILTYSELRARELYENYRFFDNKALLFPARDLIFYSADIHSSLIVQQRIQALKAILEEDEAVIITTMGSFLEHLIPLEEFRKHLIHIQSDSVINLDILKMELTTLGYERVGQVEGYGQFAMRGGIVDIFPLTEENPIRLELWGDEVDSIRSFDVESQRSIENLSSLTIYPASEVLAEEDRIRKGIARMERDVKKAENSMRQNGMDEAAGRLLELFQETKEKLSERYGNLGLDGYVSYFYDKTVSFCDYFAGKRTLFVLDEPNRIEQEGMAIEQEFRRA